MKKLIFLICLSFPFCLIAQNMTSKQYKEDFDYLWHTVYDNYCYWNKKQTNWEKVRSVYSPLFDTVSSKGSFISLLEKVFYELYDHHASLNANTSESQRLVPTGADLWAEYRNGKPTITEVKQGSGAEKVGIKAGMQIIAVNDIAVEKAVQRFLPTCLKEPDTEAQDYALRLLLAGKHSQKRKITASYQNRPVEFYPDDPVNLLEYRDEKPDIEGKTLGPDIGYILIYNALGADRLIREFDSVLTTLTKTKALILDLRNTPSGGVTTVARSILGHFISKEGFYQKHELTAEEKESGVKRSWMEIVSPRKPIYQKSLVILADHWTGSVGEGIVVGFDALKRGIIIGTAMAALNGAIYSFRMPNTGIGFSFPAEKIFHVNGTARENFRPAIEVDQLKKSSNKDYILQEALNYLKKKI